MKFPLVKFEINKTLDKEVCLNFIDAKINGYDFGKERIISEHPELKGIRGKKKSEMKKKIFQYVDSYYKIHEKEIKNSLKKTKKVWEKIEKKYFQELQKIFGNLQFYRPRIIMVYLSIFKCGVLCKDGKSFQIWYKTANKEPAEVKRHMAHEILHLYYYAYLKKHGYKTLLKDWNHAEIFNMIILNLPQFKNLTSKEEFGYPIHRRRFKKFKKLWQKTQKIDQYLSFLKLEYRVGLTKREKKKKIK